MIIADPMQYELRVLSDEFWDLQVWSDRCTAAAAVVHPVEVFAANLPIYMIVVYRDEYLCTAVTAMSF